MNPLTVLSGFRTYLAAAGLLGYSLYQLSNADYPGAWTSLMAALAAFGLRQAIAKQTVLTQQAVIKAGGYPSGRLP